MGIDQCLTASSQLWLGSTEIVCCLLLPRQYALDIVSIMTATWVMSRTFLGSDRRFQVRSAAFA